MVLLRSACFDFAYHAGQRADASLRPRHFGEAGTRRGSGVCSTACEVYECPGRAARTTAWSANAVLRVVDHGVLMLAALERTFDVQHPE